MFLQQITGNTLKPPHAGGRAVGRNSVGRHSLGTIILTETQLADII